MSLIITEFGEINPVEIADEIVMQTMAKRPIKNKQIKNLNRNPLFNRTIDLLKEEHICTERPNTITGIYNCHGMTFANRRTGIDEDSELNKIFQDDNYREIRLDLLLCGDTALYIKQNGAYSHSGIVVSIPENLSEHNKIEIKILSKWGDGFEAIHALYQCPYFESTIKFLRCQPI
ncbi:MAG TPA: hypothetical protein PLP23_06285 [Panacibacter sp.]|nr:hypothetical protein [Panacibacter sp.]